MSDEDVYKVVKQELEDINDQIQQNNDLYTTSSRLEKLSYVIEEYIQLRDSE